MIVLPCLQFTLSPISNSFSKQNLVTFITLVFVLLDIDIYDVKMHVGCQNVALYLLFVLTALNTFKAKFVSLQALYLIGSNITECSNSQYYKCLIFNNICMVVSF